MTRRRKSKRERGWRPEDVLAGKVELRARELAELIQRVNPTDRELPAAEVARRYRLKNQLQSLLVRRFGDELEVSADREGVALLSHRGSGKSACHAVLAELDGDARSWVQRRLDEAATPEPAATPPPRPAVSVPDPVDENDRELLSEDESLLDPGLSADELLARGHDAMAAYDYELARQAYARALADSRGGAAAAEALLGLLVEHLAAYSEAAALWPRLSPEAAADVRVRLLSALAAAHLGENARAHELLRGLAREDDLAAAAEVYLVLARRSLERDDEAGDAAAAHELALARQHGGPSLALLERERELAAQVARRYAPLEARAQEAYDAGQVDEAEQRARAVLARWPESRAARALLGRIEAQRREARGGALLARAATAMAARDFAVAIGLLRETRSLDLSSEETRAEIAARLEQAEAAEREQATRAQVSEVMALLVQDRLEQGLLAYLGLDPAQRAEVRRAHDAAVLGWLEEMGAPAAGARAQAAVQAALALARAQVALARGDGHTAEVELAGHEKTLRPVSVWRTAHKQAAEAVLRSEQARAHEALARALALLDAGGDPAPVRALVDAIDSRRLSEPARGELEALRPRLAQAESRAAVEERIERALARGDLLDARDALDAGLAQTPPEQRADWQRRRDDVNARLRRDWRIRVCAGDGSRTITDRLDLASYNLVRGAVITEDGAHILLATSQRRWLFVRVVSTRDMRVVQYVSMRTPAPLRLDNLVVWNGEVTLLGKLGKILRLKQDTWDVIAWRDLSTFLGQPSLPNALLLPGTPYLWLITMAGTGRSSATIIDLERWRVHRTLPTATGITSRVDAHASQLVLIDGAKIQRGLYQAAGTLDPGYRLAESRLFFDLVVLHPRAPGLLVFDHVYGDRETRMRVRWMSPEGEELAAGDIGERTSFGCAYLGSDRERGIVFVQLSTAPVERDLVAIATDDGMRVLYRIPVPDHVALVKDASGAHCFALDDVGGELTLLPLEHEPPGFADAPAAARSILMQPFELTCNALVPARDPHLLAFRGSLPRMSGDEAHTALRTLRSNPAMDARMWADVVATLADEGHDEMLDEFVTWAQARYPDHAELALNAAEYHMRRRRWDEAVALLGAVDTGALRPRRARHRHHLWGLALFESKRYEEALAVWTRGAAHAHDEDGACELQAYIEMLVPTELDGERVTTDLGKLRCSVTAARRCLARGDARGAVAAIDHAQAWRSGDIQARARVAEAYLHSDAHGPVDEFHKLLALSAFDASCGPDIEHYLFDRLVFPGATFSKEELAALAAQVRAWLDEHAERDAPGAAGAPG